MGEWGEIYTARYLREHGYTLAATNYRCRFGEADILYFDEKILVVVEVKARGTQAIATPAEFVSEEKQRKLALTVAAFCTRYQLENTVRFDVAEVFFPEKNNYNVYKINYMKDAFRIN